MPLIGIASQCAVIMCQLLKEVTGHVEITARFGHISAATHFWQKKCDHAIDDVIYCLIGEAFYPNIDVNDLMAAPCWRQAKLANTGFLAIYFDITRPLMPAQKRHAAAAFHEQLIIN